MLGKIQIADNTSEYKSGGAFPLQPDVEGGVFISKEPETSAVIPINADWEVEIQRDNPYIVARGREELPADTVFNQAYEYAQQGLDILSVQDSDSFNTHNAWSQHIIWWPENRLQKLQIFNATKIPLSVGSVSIKTGGDEPEHDGQKPAEWHKSFRYYRLSQTTDDLFSAYRNVFLALEMILSSEVKSFAAPESQWLEDALDEAEKHPKLNLVNFTISDEINGTVGETIRDEQWKGIRNAMFHAKDGKSVLRPQNPEDRERVWEAMNQLTRLYTALVNVYLDVHISTGGVTYYGFEYTTQWMQDQSRIIVSDDSSGLSKDERLDSPEWVESQHLPTEYSTDISGNGLQAAIGSLEPGELELNCIQRLGLVRELEDDEILLAMALYEPGITFENIDDIDVVFGLQMENVNRPRSLYPL